MWCMCFIQIMKVQCRDHIVFFSSLVLRTVCNTLTYILPFLLLLWSISIFVAFKPNFSGHLGSFFLPKLKHFLFFSLPLFALIWSWRGSHGKRWHHAVLWTNQNLAIFGLKSDYSCGGGLLILPACCQWNLIRPHPRSPDEVNQLTI